MEIKEMQEKVSKIIEDYHKKHKEDYKDTKEAIFLHLTEEIGEIAREIYNEKSKWRGEFNKEKLAEELADSLAHLLRLSKEYDIDIEHEFNKKIEKLKERFELNE